MGEEEQTSSFWALPPPTQMEVLGMLGRLIARGVVAEEPPEVTSA